ncbi:MAG: Metal transporter substrate-binding protein [Chloroflexi bacterium]|nr:Metal transporter substrate-binding protein [Chloroflexota bacterium]
MRRSAPRTLISLLVGVVAAFGGAGCGGPATPGSSLDPADRINVVTTSAVFADLIRNTGGERVAVTNLVPNGADIHTYQVTPEDMRAIAAADLFVMNGLGLDDWLEGTIKAASSDKMIVRLAPDLPGVAPLPGETAATQNPHLWLDVTYAGGYVDRVAGGLKAADPDSAEAIAATAAAYTQTLADLDAWVRDQIVTIPAENRRVVTFHDALPYFARAYGLTVVGVAVEAPGQDPSAGEIAALIDAIRASGVRAIFSESQFPTALMDQLARETGTTVVANLYTDTLGAEPVTSYEALIRWDVEHLVEALR